MLAPDINKGLRNDFREAMEQVDQDYLDDMLKQQQVILVVFCSLFSQSVPLRPRHAKCEWANFLGLFFENCVCVCLTNNQITSQLTHKLTSYVVATSTD